MVCLYFHSYSCGSEKGVALKKREHFTYYDANLKKVIIHTHHAVVCFPPECRLAVCSGQELVWVSGVSGCVLVLHATPLP